MENKISFYPDIKKHISPSAVAMWKDSKSAFMKSYFANEKFEGNASTKGGSIIHTLIEQGFIPVHCKYQNSEKELHIPFSSVYKMFGSGEEATTVNLEVFGKPDSHGFDSTGKLGIFVDYKSGKENNWDNVKLGSDIKMLVTAWLVWKDLGEPETVKAFIEYIPTVWVNETKEIAWNGDPTTLVAEHLYTKEDMQQAGILIAQVINEVNLEYPKWGESTSSYVKEEDVKAYAELQKQIDELEEKQKPIKERIKEQMSFGGIKSYKDEELGTFSITVKKSYNIPEDLLFQVGETKYTVKEGEKIADAMKVSVDNYKLTAEPVSVSESIGFKAKKSK